MYAVTVTVITAETGNILLGLKLGVIAASAKTLVAKIHHWWHTDTETDVSEVEYNI